MAQPLLASAVIEEFLRSSQVIDFKHPSVRSKATELSDGQSSPSDIARQCFEWVRDNVQHSVDFERNPVTCAASDVLAYRTGYCYAKSHLLAALLRANGIPAGLCYQRLSLDGHGAPFSLHGLAAAYLPEHGWYRIDPRGNKPGVNAQFAAPVERLAFKLTVSGEKDFQEILPEPLPVVVNALRAHSTWDEMLANLPDWNRPTLHG